MTKLIHLSLFSLLFIVFASSAFAKEPAKSERQQIGEVLGEPIYLDELQASRIEGEDSTPPLSQISSKRNSRLRELFLCSL